MNFLIFSTFQMCRREYSVTSVSNANSLSLRTTQVSPKSIVIWAAARKSWTDSRTSTGAAWKCRVRFWWRTHGRWTEARTAVRLSFATELMKPCQLFLSPFFSSLSSICFTSNLLEMGLRNYENRLLTEYYHLSTEMNRIIHTWVGTTWIRKLTVITTLISEDKNLILAFWLSHFNCSKEISKFIAKYKITIISSSQNISFSA